MDSTRRLRPRKQRKEAEPKIVEPEKRGINTSGLAVLPDELLLEIVSYLPSPPAPSKRHEPNDAMAYVQQRELFLALSMSCQRLRRFFRPYVWRRLEVTRGMRIGETMSTLYPWTGKEAKVAYATELIRQLEIVTIRDPSLAEYVQIANFEITDFSIHSVFVELGRCFALFPNLHTVKLDMHDPLRRRETVTVSNGFGKHIYPSIRHVILAPRACPLLLSCPNVKSVQCISHDTLYTDLVKYLHKSPCIESVGYSFRLTELEDVARALPNLRQLTLYCHTWPFLGVGIEATLDNLVLMQQLQEVTLDLLPCSAQLRDPIIAKVSQHLQNLQERNGGKKQIQFLNAPAHLRQTITFPPNRMPTS